MMLLSLWSSGTERFHWFRLDYNRLSRLDRSCCENNVASRVLVGCGKNRKGSVRQKML